MRISNIKLAAAVLAAAFSIQLATAQNARQPKDTKGAETLAANAALTTAKAPAEPRYSPVSGDIVKLQNGDRVGMVENLLIDQKTGKVAFLVIGRGGILGFGVDLVPIPWQEVASVSNKQIMLKVDRQKLQSAPTLERSYAKLNTPGFLSKVDQYYGIEIAARGAGK